MLYVIYLICDLNAQINGNGNKITQFYPIENFLKLEINLIADIIIDAQAKSGLMITTDENVLDYINLKVKGGFGFEPVKMD